MIKRIVLYCRITSSLNIPFPAGMIHTFSPNVHLWFQLFCLLEFYWLFILSLLVFYSPITFCSFFYRLNCSCTEFCYFPFLFFPEHVPQTNITHSARGTEDDRRRIRFFEVFALELVAALKSIYFMKQWGLLNDSNCCPEYIFPEPNWITVSLLNWSELAAKWQFCVPYLFTICDFHINLLILKIKTWAFFSHNLFLFPPLPELKGKPSVKTKESFSLDK